MTETGLTFELATLSEAAENDAVFEQLDVLKAGSYAVRAKDMQRTIALVEASPSYLSQRMKMVENRLAGDQKIVLTTDATAQIGRFKQCQYVIDGQMWPLPYQTIWQEIRLGAERQQWLSRRLRPFIFPPQMPLLWQARNYYFKGQFTGKPSATMFYQAARRSDFSMDSAVIGEQDKQQWQEIKIDASYWLGLLVAQTGNYRSAEDYLKTRVLAANPGGKWENAATYNLARVAEATDQVPLAIQLYQIHLTAPQTQGNLVRARWLMELTGQNNLTPTPDAPSKEGEEKSPEGKEAKKAAETAAAGMEAGDKSKEAKEAETDKESPAKDSEKPTAEKPAPQSNDKESSEAPKESKAEKQPSEGAAKKPDEETPAPKDEKSSAAPKKETSPATNEEKPKTEAKDNSEAAK